jgi:hypothetical protein
VNSLWVEEAVAEAVLLEEPVAVAAWLEATDCALEMALAITLDKLLAADSTAELASEMTAEADAEADEAAAEVTLAAADETAEELSGISMGTPAAAQVDSTPEMVVAWSASEQAFCTQG